MASGLSRVTIVASRSRLDVALPADVPLIDLLPTLLDLAGGATDEAARRDGWSLSRLGGGELDSSRTPAQLEVRDGELLYLHHRGGAAPVTVFDDAVDALATGARDRSVRWTPAASRIAGLTFALVALVAGVLALPIAGPSFRAAGLTGLAIAVALLLVAVVFARALGRVWAGTAFALVGTGYAAVGGMLVLASDARDFTLAHVVVAATAAIVAATIGAVGVPAAAPALLAVAAFVGAGLAAASGTTVLDTGLPGAAAATVVLAYATLPAMPLLAYRLAGLPGPTVPTERENLRQDTEPVDGVRVIELGRRADAFLAAMLGALSAISATAAILVSRAGVPGLALAGVLALLPVLRSRWFAGRAHRLPLLLAGGIAMTAVAVAAFLAADPSTRLPALGAAAVAVAAISIGLGLGAERAPSPRWGRLLDILEILLILAIAPLAIWVSGVLETVRAIRG